MIIFGKKRYEILPADSPLLKGKTFQKTDKLKFILGEDIMQGSILKAVIPAGGIVVTRNESHTICVENFEQKSEVYIALDERLWSIEFPEGTVVSEEARQSSGGSAAPIELQDKTITENGTYSADAGYDGLGNVTVDVEKEVVVSNEELYSVLNAIVKRSTLTSLPDGITEIGDYAFYKYDNLKITSLPDSIRQINSYAFGYCTNIAITTFPVGIGKINNYCFTNCKGLTILDIPSNIVQIGAMAFQNCTNLISVTFEDVCAIDPNAFSGCSQSNLVINVPWAEGEVAYAPWGASKATVNYNYTGE